MRFEKPIMNISMFAMENVATDASAVITQSNLEKANADAEVIASEKENVVSLAVTF